MHEDARIAEDINGKFEVQTSTDSAAALGKSNNKYLPDPWSCNAQEQPMFTDPNYVTQMFKATWKLIR